MLGVSDSEFNDILRSHLVSPDYMYKDDFYGFLIIEKNRYYKELRKLSANKFLGSINRRRRQICR